MSICRACLKRDKALDIGLPEENWHVLDRLVLAIRTTDINYSMARKRRRESNRCALYGLHSLISATALQLAPDGAQTIEQSLAKCNPYRAQR